MSFWQAARREASGALRSVRYDFVQVLFGQSGSRRVMAVTGLTALVAAGGVGTAFAVADNGHQARGEQRAAAVASTPPGASPDSLSPTPSASSGSPSGSPSGSASASEPAVPTPTGTGRATPSRSTTPPHSHRPTPRPGPTSHKPSPTPTHSKSPSPSPTPSDPTSPPTSDSVSPSSPE